MSNLKLRVPDNWPSSCKKPYLKAFKAASNKQKQYHLYTAVQKYADFCQLEEVHFLSFESVLRFWEFVKKKYSVGMAQRHSVCIAQMAWCIDDKLLRDQLFDYFLDKRTPQELFSEAYIPQQVAFLCKRAYEEGEFELQHWRYFDRYLRVVDRLGSLPQEIEGIVDAFWFNPPSFKTQSAILGKAADLIDLLMPGHADANQLRKTQRFLRNANVQRKEKVPPKINPEIVQLVEAARKTKSKSVGAPYADKTKASHRAILQIYEKTLNEAGMPFSLVQDAFNIFADHANLMFELSRLGTNEPQSGEKTGWRAITIASFLRTLNIFVDDKDLSEAIRYDACLYEAVARKTPKRKELLLLRRPISLQELFLKSLELLRRSEDAPIESRHRIPEHIRNADDFPATRDQLIKVASVLALLCFYPLRRADVLGLRFGHELVKELSGWHLISLPTQKTGQRTDPIRFPSVMTPFLDAAVLHGDSEDKVWTNYQDKKGHFLWGDWKTGEPTNSNDLTVYFNRFVGYTPHLLRSLWTDYLLDIGADRVLVSAMLQHSNLISQEEYEVLIGKLRLRRAAKKLAEIVNEISDSI